MIRTRKAGCGRIPCTFPIDQGIIPRDEFPPDSTHRHQVSRCRDFRRALGPSSPCVSEPETGVPGLEDMAARDFDCCQAGRFGFGLDLGVPQRRSETLTMEAGLNSNVRRNSRGDSLVRAHGSRMVRDAMRRTSLYLGIGRGDCSRVGDEGEGERLNDFG